ncbi:MAG: hypothetical protein ACFFBD_01400, partial [Candidatus Hodarchaeota archaeon]
EIATLLTNQRAEKRIREKLGLDRIAPNTPEYKKQYDLYLKMFITFFENFGKLLFERRPTAMQFAGGIIGTLNTAKTNPEERVRTKWGDYWLKLEDLTEAAIKEALNEASKTTELLQVISESLGTGLYILNALDSDKVIGLFEDIIDKKIIEQRKKKVTVKKIRRF